LQLGLLVSRSKPDFGFTSLNFMLFPRPNGLLKPPIIIFIPSVVFKRGKPRVLESKDSFVAVEHMQTVLKTITRAENQHPVTAGLVFLRSKPAVFRLWLGPFGVLPLTSDGGKGHETTQEYSNYRILIDSHFAIQRLKWEGVTGMKNRVS